jgi:putative membrane protein
MEKLMFIPWLLATLHLLALGIGLGAVWVRASALRGLRAGGTLQRVFLADTFWGVAAVLWIGTGLFRAFGGTEKGTEYYIHNGVFLFKMVLLIIILILEVWPMATLIKWRIRAGRSERPDTAAAAAMARISWVQAALVILMVFAATAMARGYGANTW